MGQMVTKEMGQRTVCWIIHTLWNDINLSCRNDEIPMAACTALLFCAGD